MQQSREVVIRKTQTVEASKVRSRPPQGQSKEENTRCSGHTTQVLGEEVQLKEAENPSG